MKAIRKTVGQMLNEVSLAHPKNDALIHTETGTRLNYQLLYWEVERAALGLLNLGIQKGDHIALWAPNIPEWIIAQLAVARTGALLVPLDPAIERDDLFYILDQARVKAIIQTRGAEPDGMLAMLQSLRDRLPLLEHQILLSDISSPGSILWSEIIAEGDDLPSSLLDEREREIRPQDPLAVMYTSGTTGRPKGVVLDHESLINKSMASTYRQGITSTDRACLFFPLFHMFGNTCIALATLLRGAALVMPCRVFNPELVLQALSRESCTALYGSPSMIVALLDHPRFNGKKWKTVKKGTLGGAPCPMELMKRLVYDVGVRDVTVAYGITETASWITMTHPGDPIDLRVSTIGTALPVNEVRIVDPDSGTLLPAGSPGEICVRGYLMKEYYRMPAATAAAVDRDGWFHSGDLGMMDDKGYVRISGRLKDTIERDGVRVHPGEIEEILYSIPEISEVQVFGFPHPERGQEIAAWFRTRESAEVSVERVRGFLEKRVTPETAPHFYKRVDSFPTTPSGKIQKYKLSEAAQAEYAPRGSHAP